MKTRTNLDQQLLNALSDLKADQKVNPSVVYKINSKIRILNLISDDKNTYTNNNFVFIKKPNFAFKLAGIFLITLLFISTGTVLAAQSAKPKNTLYPIKIASENIALKLSPSPFKADIALEIVKRRGEEIDSKKTNLDNQALKGEIEHYKESINQAKVLVPSVNSNLNRRLRVEEDNFDELTRQYEDSQLKEGKSKTENQVKGVSDYNIKLIETKNEQNNQTELKTTEINRSNDSQRSPEEIKSSEENK